MKIISTPLSRARVVFFILNFFRFRVLANFIVVFLYCDINYEEKFNLIFPIRLMIKNVMFSMERIRPETPSLMHRVLHHKRLIFSKVFLRTRFVC